MAILNVPNQYNAPSVLGQSYFYVLTAAQWSAACKQFATQEIRDKMKYLFASPYEVIRSFRVYPFGIARDSGFRLKLGFADLTDFDGVGTVGRITDFKDIIDMGQVFVGYRTNSFLDNEPYTTAQLYLPYIGFSNLSMKDILGAWLHVYYVVDYSTGAVNAYTVRQRVNTPGNDDKLLAINEGMIALEIPILSNNAMSLANQQRIAEKQARTQSTIVGASSAIGTTAAIITAIVGFASGNVPVGITGTASAVSATAGGAAKLVQVGVSKANTIAGMESHFGSIGTPGGVSAWYAPQRVALYRTHINTPTITNYDKLYGRPLEATRKLNQVAGYTEIAQIHLEGFENATSAELDELELLLRTGVHFPPIS